MKKRTEIRWVIAHDPLSLFMRAAESFAQAINRRSSTHMIDVEIMTLSQYSERYNDGIRVTKHDLLGLMESGKIEMSQMYTTWLAEKYYPDMHVLDLPFLFRDHGHAQQVLEGAIGEELLGGLSQNANVRGLAFTYSGGFRMIPGQQAIRRIEDFQGMALRSNKNPFAMDTFRAVGAIPVPRELEELNDGIVNGEFVGGESAWPRVYPLMQNTHAEFMNDTQHSLFLTSMIIRSDFWDSLDANVQILMKEAAVDAARQERAESIRDGERAKSLAREEGIEIVAWLEEEKQKFVDATAIVYETYQDFFSPDLVSRIKKH